MSEQHAGGKRVSARCVCRTPAGTRCNAVPSQEDMLCERCRAGRPVMDDGKHWCWSSSTDDESRRTRPEAEGSDRG